MVYSDNSRQRLLDAAVELISTDPDQNISVREICARAGVQLPTLYHFFEHKRGLLDAVARVGYERLVARVDAALETAGDDPFDRLAAAWDAYVGMGTEQPLLATFMYGRLSPGRPVPGAELRQAQLLTLTSHAAASGLLTVSAEEAAARFHAAVTGVVVHLISTAQPDPALSAAARAATFDAIRRRGEGSPAIAGQEVAIHAAALAAALERRPNSLPAEESQLLVKWLRALAVGAAR